MIAATHSPQASPSDVRLVLVRRLLKLYDPWDALHEDRRDFLWSIRRATPITQYVKHGERHCYDAGRVRFLLDSILGGWTPDPVEIDNYFSYGHYSGIALIDGHHRLIAAHYAKRETIPAIIGGWVDMAEWLCGQRRRMPEWGVT